MKLHRLSLTAIGPFPDRVDIDFSRLGESGLFLLEGPTGSGKSTIIDAISFALYGKVAQSSAVVERMKSDHAPPGTEPIAELVFETHRGVYRIRRTPSYQRQKKRGSGTTTAHMTVKVWRLGTVDEDRMNPESGELLSANLGDAEDEITRAIGLTHAQFVQTVVLPQGEFAQFLQSKTDDKKALLQRLFGTEVLAGMQSRLIEGRRDAEQRRAAAAGAVQRAMHAFIGAAGVDETTAAQLCQHLEAGEAEAATAVVTDIVTALSATEREWQSVSAAAELTRAAAEAALRNAQDLHRRRARRDALRAERDALAGSAAEVTADRAVLAAAERALAVVGSAEALEKAIARSDEARKLDERARRALPDELMSSDETALRSAAGDQRTALGTLADAASRERGLAALHTEHDTVTATIAELKSSIAQATGQVKALPQMLNDLATERETLAITASRTESTAQELSRARHRLGAAQQAVEAARIAAEEEQITIAALSALEQHQHRLSVLRTTRVASIAGELGLALKSGDPCAVCGSVEHPQPASPGRNHVSQDDVDAAEAEFSRLRDTAENCRRQLEEQRRALTDLQIAADQLSPEMAQSKVDQLSESMAACVAAGERIGALETELAEIAQRQLELTDLVQQANVETATLNERSGTLRKQIMRDERAVLAARAGFDTVADRIAAITAAVVALDAAAEATSLLADAVRAALDCGAAFAEALRSTEFADQQDWQQARRVSSEIALLRKRIRDFEDRWSAVHAKLEEPEVTDAALDGELPRIDTLTTTVREAEAAEREAAGLFGAAHERNADGRRHAEWFAKALADAATVLAATAAAIRIGNLVAGLGDNQLRMELATYVLVRRFAEVVSAANAQLRRISSGRYQLEHTSNRTGNARSGLGLLVLDLQTGRPRDPGTLSGGETFYVSLALALGLADVVRSESGGVDLGTLFIDEGFGTLDPEVLDEVLGVLDSLRLGGRSVGLVSHVAELKARIADRIELRPNPDGSSRLKLMA